MTELVRMIPRAPVVFGKLVFKEFFGCPFCLEAKFDLSGKPVNLPAKYAKDRKRAHLKIT